MKMREMRKTERKQEVKRQLKCERWKDGEKKRWKDDENAKDGKTERKHEVERQ